MEWKKERGKMHRCVFGKVWKWDKSAFAVEPMGVIKKARQTKCKKEWQTNEQTNDSKFSAN